MTEAEGKPRAKHARLRSEDGIPLYLKLASIFRDRIHSGAWPMGRRIGSLPELQAQYGVARATVQQAIRQLSRQGLLSSERGRGTFVTGVVEDRRERAPAFDQLALDPSFSIDVLSRSGTDLPVELLQPLPEKGGPFIHIRKRHLLRGEPYSLVDLCLPMSLYGLLPEGGDAERLYAQLIRDHTGIAQLEARTTITIAPASHEHAALLGVALAAPLARCDSLVLDGGGRPIFSHRSLIRGDRFVMRRVTSDLFSIDPDEWRPGAPPRKEPS